MAEIPSGTVGAKALSKLSQIALPGVGKNVVVLLGGQIEGLQGAVFLRKRGRNVTVLEESDTAGAAGCRRVTSSGHSPGFRRRALRS